MMKKFNSAGFLTDEELALVKDKIKTIEMRTIGEIVPVIIDKSSDHRDGIIISASLLSFLIGTLLMLITGEDSFWIFFIFFITALLPSYFFVKYFPQTHTLFISRKVRQKRVRDRALVAFYENGLYKTAGQTGVLIFISLLERGACILGDKGINRLIAQNKWNSIISGLIKGISTGKHCEALLYAIDECGNILAEHFPADGTNNNELNDEVISILHQSSKAEA